MAENYGAIKMIFFRAMRPKIFEQQLATANCIRIFTTKARIFEDSNLVLIS